MKFKIAPNLNVRRGSRKQPNCRIVSYSRSHYPRSQYASMTQSSHDWRCDSSRDPRLPTTLRRKYA